MTERSKASNIDAEASSAVYDASLAYGDGPLQASTMTFVAIPVPAPSSTIVNGPLVEGLFTIFSTTSSGYEGLAFAYKSGGQEGPDALP